jgi:hypothetical protein
MVPSFRDVSHGMYGAWRLARFDPLAMAWFDHSVEGVWHSFWAAAFAYPGFLALVALGIAPEQRETAEALRILLVESIGYVIAWAAFPLIILAFCRWLEREEQCFGFIIAYNWSQVLQTTLWLVVTALVTGDLLPAPVAVLLSLATVVALLAYEWFIARTALEAGGVAATVVVLIDVFFAEILQRVTQALY